MINSKEDLRYYIISDLKSMGKYPLSIKNICMGGGNAVYMEVSDKDEEMRICEKL